MKVRDLVAMLLEAPQDAYVEMDHDEIRSVYTSHNGKAVIVSRTEDPKEIKC